MKLNESRQSVGYVEHVAGGQVIDVPETVDSLINLFGQLQAEALSPSRALAWLQKINGEHYGELEEE